MIRKLKESDKESLIEYLKPEAEINLFIIGDIEYYGFDSGYQELWGDFSEGNNSYQAVLLRYYNSFLLYTDNTNSYDFVPFSKKLNEFIKNEAIGVISAKKIIMDKLIPLLNIDSEKKRKSCYYLKCEEINTNFPVSHLNKVRYATVYDVYDISELLDKKIVEFELNRDTERMKKNIESGMSKIVYIKNSKGHIISTSAISAENKYSAMVVAVATDPEHRGNGYASACVYEITKYLIDKGKTACLFYDNPKAGTIYKKLGYFEIDKWDMLFL